MSQIATGASSVVVERLVKRFGAFTAVNDVSFTVHSGEIMGFLGPNGAGKSTIIRMLCGLLRPTSGRALVAGFDVAREPEAVREHIGYMSQKFSLYNDLTVIENLRFFGGMYGVEGRAFATRSAWALEMAGLLGRESTLTAELASGWKQRLALGCAVLHRPPVLFLDEPTSGVDPLARRAFWELIQQMAASGVTVFVSTHYMDEAEYCHRLALIDRGQLVGLGAPAELKTHALRGELLDLDCEPLGLAIEVIREAPGVLDAAVFGSTLHVVVADGNAALQELPPYLRARGVTLSRIRRIYPSLEDVFVQQLSGRLAEKRATP
ncbi:MAG TPA: multidrug ABC transporter ATP-binding protein [Deltaproteobacteria bacterium]|jgi:ABC-2 type transport system ATP-binding protein|nr:multidrug ABC transporter ATP-binding protein [Deltaproteobacteria bacterium]